MLYRSSFGDIITTNKTAYYKKAIALIDSWESGCKEFEFSTSGSSGQPKIITFTRTQIEDSVKLTQKAFNLKSDDLLICPININYTGGKMMLFRSLVLNTELIIVEPTANPLAQLIKHENLIRSKTGKIFISLVPLQLQEILNGEPFENQLLKMAKAVLLGGSGLSPSQEEKFSDLNFPLFLGYGMTETLSHVALKDLKEPQKGFSPINGVEIRANHKQQAEVKSPVTLNRWIETNDLIKFTNRRFEILGRSDNTIISGGVKIQLEEIERTINLETNYRVLAYGIPDEQLGQKLIIVAECSNTEGQELISQALRSKLSKYKQPKEIYFLDSFVEGQSQKIDKKATLNAAIHP